MAGAAMSGERMKILKYLDEHDAQFWSYQYVTRPLMLFLGRDYYPRRHTVKDYKTDDTLFGRRF